MRHVPRLAVGAIQPGAHREPAIWALTAALAHKRQQPILFRSSFDLARADGGKAILGRASRHLDSWAMSRSDAISALARAVGSHETAIVEGTFDGARSTHHSPTDDSTAHHSSLDRLCEWLDLPRVAVVDVRLLAERGLPLRPKRIDALLLDRVHDAYDAAYWQTTLETLWKTPVVGWLDEAPAHRAACLPSAGNPQPSREHCDALAQRLLPTLRLDRLTQLARRAGGLPF